METHMWNIPQRNKIKIASEGDEHDDLNFPSLYIATKEGADTCKNCGKDIKKFQLFGDHLLSNPEEHITLCSECMQGSELFESFLEKFVKKEFKEEKEKPESDKSLTS